MLIHFVLGTLAFAIILINTFYSFPIMGHDYSIMISWANDYHFAWKNFSEFHYHFSPQRCLGIPVWANPIGFSLSLFHLLTAFLNDISAIVLYIGVYIGLGYWGARNFLKLLKIDSKWSYYLAFAWCLQGAVSIRVMVGHLAYLSAVLWPLYAYILLKDSGPFKSKRNLLEILGLGLLLGHDFYSGSPTIYVLFPMSFLLMVGVFRICDLKLAFKKALLKLGSALFISALVILPKVMAVYSFTNNFQRKNSFLDVGLSAGFSYSFLSQLFPPILDYKKMTGWWYGDWEALNFIFPGLLLLIFILSVLRLKVHSRIFLSFILVFSLGGFIASGVYAEIIQSIPIIKSFHVNPRWLMMMSLPLWGIICVFFTSGSLSHKLIIPLILLSALIPFYLRDNENLQINYLYRNGLDVEQNRLKGCYEPVFGYSLELFPIQHMVPGKFMDPRCYLVKGGCKSMVLPDDKVDELKEYRLRPFE